MTAPSRSVKCAAVFSICRARTRRSRPSEPSAIAGMAGKSASACMSTAQGKRSSSRSAVRHAVSGMPAIRCSSGSSGSAAESGAIVSGNAPRRLMQPLTAKRRASGCAYVSACLAAVSTVILSSIRASSSVSPRATVVSISDVGSINAPAAPPGSGVRNGAAGTSQKPSAHVSTPMRAMPSGRAKRTPRIQSTSTSRVPVSVK